MLLIDETHEDFHELEDCSNQKQMSIMKKKKVSKQIETIYEKNEMINTYSIQDLDKISSEDSSDNSVSKNLKTTRVTDISIKL